MFALEGTELDVESESFAELFGVDAKFELVGLVGHEGSEHKGCAERVHVWFTGGDFVCEFVFGAEFGGVDPQCFGGEEGCSRGVMDDESFCEWALFGLFADDVEEWDFPGEGA